MKVILNEEVHGLGEPGKLVDVAPGYARNYLVPRKLAVYANTGNIKELEHHQRRLERKHQRLQVAAQSTATRINGKVLTIEARVGKEGKLFGTVTSTDIADRLKAQFDVDIDRRRITLREPIRTVGEHQADIRLLGDTHATVTINVLDAAHSGASKPAPVAQTVEEAAPANVSDTSDTSDASDASGMSEETEA